MSLGLSGAHRTGKSTLAKVLSARTAKPFIPTNTSAIFEQFGVDPAAPMDFQTRLRIQNEILAAYEEIWSTQKGSFIADRTPVDLMAYTLADIQGSTEDNFLELEEYMNRCFNVTNKIFDALILIQPGIPLIKARGKAAMNRSYMEHLNSLILGLCHDERLDCGVLVMKREVVTLEERVQIILGKGYGAHPSINNSQ